MPFYEYECSACKYYLEVLQKITDAPMVKCPSCGKDELHRLISAPVFRLKGAGWYETDFKSDKENKRNLAEEKEPAAKTDSDDAKPKVRASKALKKAARKAGKKAARQPARKVVKAKSKPQKPAKKAIPKKTAGKLSKKSAKKSLKKAKKQAGKK